MTNTPESPIYVQSAEEIAALQGQRLPNGVFGVYEQFDEQLGETGRFVLLAVSRHAYSPENDGQRVTLLGPGEAMQTDMRSFLSLNMRTTTREIGNRRGNLTIDGHRRPFWVGRLGLSFDVQH